MSQASDTNGAQDIQQRVRESEAERGRGAGMDKPKQPTSNTTHLQLLGQQVHPRQATSLGWCQGRERNLQLCVPLGAHVQANARHHMHRGAGPHLGLSHTLQHHHDGESGPGGPRHVVVCEQQAVWKQGLVQHVPRFLLVEQLVGTSGQHDSGGGVRNGAGHACKQLSIVHWGGAVQDDHRHGGCSVDEELEVKAGGGFSISIEVE